MGRRKGEGNKKRGPRYQKKDEAPADPAVQKLKADYSKYFTKQKAPKERFRGAARGDKAVSVADEFGLAHQFYTGDAGARWISCVINPFGSGEQGGSTVLERPPDGDSTRSYLIKVTGTAVFNGTTATSGIIQLLGHCVNGSTTDQDVQILYGTDATVGTNVPTTPQEAFCDQAVNLGTIWTSSDKGRIVSAGLRVNGNKLDTASGLFQAYETHSVIRYGVASYDPYASAYHNPLGDTYDIKQGITVRKSCDDNAFTYVNAMTTSYAAAVNPFGNMPTIRFSQLSATTVLTIDWVIVYEVKSRVILAFPPGKSDYEKDFQGLVWYVNRMPQVCEGHTFRPFSEIWKGVKAVGRWAWENGVGNLAKSALSSGVRRARGYLDQ